MENYILELHNIVKTFGTVRALNSVSFKLKPGEIHCLMGENGAGKSTFIKIITGVLQPDSGEIFYRGQEVHFENTIQSSKAGIACIYQHPANFPSLSVTENIFMSQEILTKLHTYNWSAMRKASKKLLESLGSKIDPNASMSSLGVAEQQIVEIAKALSRNAKILILDEPTASLTKFECEKLYALLDILKQRGVSMIFITHRFEDMYRLADRITVFRDATYIGTYEMKGIKESELIKAMVGRELKHLYPSRNVNIGNEVLRVEHVSRTGFFKDISFNVKKGEVLALTGLVGSGRSEVCEAIFGINHFDHGKVFLEGKEIHVKNPKHALELGIGLLPEDRQLTGLLLDLPIYQNVSAMALNKFEKTLTIMDKNKEIEAAERICKNLRLKAESVIAPPSSLSGGNQQKVVFAKLLNRDLKVLILDEPTKGIDILAKNSIYEIINELAAQGHAIIMISSEMPEVLGVADRIVVMRSGHIAAEMLTKDATQEKIMEASVKS
ncbi:MAG: sugar ABC transporter ATP-binding protein [Bacilli bacterium]|nr:sugar ABC transporter ATP-binding protein [Bacilli bacterium]